MKTRRRLVLAAAAIALAPQAAFSQTSTPGVIRLVVPFAPGGGNDIMARIIAPKIAELVGQQVIVENRAGAGGNIGSLYVAKSAPDGATLLLATNTLTINPFLLKDLPFDVARDFAPVARVANQPVVIVVNPGLPIRNVQELVAHAKANAGKLNYATPGKGTPHHFAAELFRQAAGIDMVHVPYKGASPALTDLVAGRVDVMFASLISALPFIQSGRLRAIATGEGKRLSLLKDLPTVKESGYPDYEATIWGGILAPAGTPDAVIQKLSAGVVAAARDSALRKRLIDAGFEITPETSEELKATVAADLRQWAKVTKAAGLVAE